jgi:hypothetical protein
MFTNKSKVKSDNCINEHPQHQSQALNYLALTIITIYGTRGMAQVVENFLAGVMPWVQTSVPLNNPSPKRPTTDK